MLARRLDEMLAQTDPFDLAQAAERYVHTLSAPEIRRLIDAAKPRLNEYYAEEFSRVQAIDDGDSLRAAFAHELGANLRVIPLFGATFAQAILEHAPSERAVGFSDERAIHTPRIIAGTVVALSLAAVAVAGGHYVTTSRSQSNAAVAAGAPPPVTAVLPSPSQAIQRRTAVSRAARPAVTAQPQHPGATVAPPGATAAYAARAPSMQEPAYAPVAAHRAPVAAAGRVTKHVAAVPVAHGEAVVQVPAAPRRPAAQPESSPATLDTTDMPQPYTDATPLPDETPVPATDVPRVMHVANPTPAPRHGWFHRTIMHLDPFKPRPASTP